VAYNSKLSSTLDTIESNYKPESVKFTLDESLAVLMGLGTAIKTIADANPNGNIDSDGLKYIDDMKTASEKVVGSIDKEVLEATLRKRLVDND
jgi:hypothetical protein